MVTINGAWLLAVGLIVLGAAGPARALFEDQVGKFDW